MSAGFDPYYTWLAIPPEEQPPHLYRLLGVKPLEENLDVIENAADQRMLHLRTYGSGKQAEHSQKLLNEVAAAKVALLDPAKKSAYDAELRAKLSAAKQAEVKKIREERPLAVAKPLATAAPLAAKPAARSPAVQIAAPQPSAKPRAANNLVPLIVIGVVALVLLGVGGLAAMMFLGPKEPAVAVNTNPDGVPPITAPGTDEPATTTPAPPVVPPVVPPPNTSDKPPVKTPTTTVEEPAIAETDPQPPIDDEPVAEEPADDETPAVAEAEPVDDEPQKLPIPEKIAREAKRKEILAIFPIAQAKTFEEKGELAAQLISTAGETVDDPAAVFAMLNLAREQAAEAGHIKLAFEATDMLGETFDFDASAVRIASLQQASRAQLPPAAKRDIVIAGMDVIDELSATDKFDEADALSDRMLALARPLRDAGLIKELAEQKHAVDDVAASYKKAQSAFETLKTTPDDPEANLAAGKYLTFVKQDRDAGLAHLSKGSDAALAAAAKGELAAPESAEDQTKLADAWWAAGEVQTDVQFKRICHGQAAHWYREVVDTLTGLVKVKVEKRIAAAGDASGIGIATRQSNEVVYLDDIAETSSKVGAAELGKHGFREGWRFADRQLEHSLTTHAVTDGIAHVTYQLDGNFHTFETAAGLWPLGGGRSTQSGTPIIFRVVGDEKPLWQSSPIQKHGVSESCRVSVRGVKTLRLEAHCAGNHVDAWAVWIEPRILGMVTASPETEPGLNEPRETAHTYLDDLAETDSKIGYGSLGKLGDSGFNDGKHKVFAGVRPTHSLSMAPPSNGTSHVTYELDSKYVLFQATAALWEESGYKSQSKTPLTFKVVGDGKTLWESPTLQKHGDSLPCRIDVEGIETLTLEVHCPGSFHEAWPVWVDPRLTPLKATAVISKPPRRIDLKPKPVVAVATGSNHHTVFVNGQKLLDCGRDKATTAACILKPGDVITVRLGDRFDIKSFWMLVLSDKGEPLFETSENWIGYLPADDARWWDVSTKGLKQEPAQFTGDGREYVGHVQGAAAAALPTLKSQDKAQPIFSPLHGGDNRAFLAYVVTVDDLKPKKK